MRDLRPREIEVLQAIADVGSKRAADRLGLSKHTVREHVCNALRITGTSHRAHLIAIGLREGWLH